jgi:hypothetical protein
MEEWLNAGNHAVRKKLDDLLKQAPNRRLPELPFFLKHDE